MTSNEVRAARAALGMSVVEFAQALGVQPTTARRWEMRPTRSNYRFPGADTVKAIARLVATGSQ